MKKNVLTVSQTSEFTGLDKSEIASWITRDWVSPVVVNALDAEDVARLQLIRELQHDFGSNDEAIPLILHLLDQLYYLRARLSHLTEDD